MLATALIALLAAQDGTPAPPPDDATATAKAAFAAGKQQYDLGYFATALVEFEKAYAAKPLPAFLFNIGQCHFQERRYDRALFFYERYLELVPEATNRELVEGLIKESRDLRDKAERAARETQEPAPPPVVVQPPPPPPAVEPPPDNTMWVVAGVGVGAAVVVGGVIALVAMTQVPPSGTLGTIDGRSP